LRRKYLREHGFITGDEYGHGDAYRIRLERPEECRTLTLYTNIGTACIG